MSTLKPQQRIGSFILLEKIGAGGLGEVWKARDPRLNRVVALKFIQDTDQRAARDLMREARAASALNHPNIITVLEIGESAGRVYVATEFVEGETLRALMDKSRMPLQKALDIAIQAAHGLSSAHQNGIVHRDIKPENVMIRIDGYVKVVDFGLAKVLPWSEDSSTDASESGNLSGTFTYMSPEQARGRTVGAESDVFSFGIVLYELLSGEHPFRAGNALDTLTRIINSEPPSLRTRCPELPTELHDIVDRCLKKDRKQRFPSAVDLETDLRAARIAPVSKPRYRWRSIVAVLGLLLFLAALSWTWWSSLSEAGVPASVRSVAVMNFKSASRDPVSVFLAGNLSEELGSALSVAGFQIPQRSLVLALDGPTDARSIGDRLQVDAILEGSITSFNDSTRLYIELVDTKTGFQIWSKSLTVRQADLFTNGLGTAKDIAAQVRDAMNSGR